MIEFKTDPKTGEVKAYKDGKFVGVVDGFEPAGDKRTDAVDAFRKRRQKRMDSLAVDKYRNRRRLRICSRMDYGVPGMKWGQHLMRDKDSNGGGGDGGQSIMNKIESIEVPDGLNKNSLGQKALIHYGYNKKPTKLTSEEFDEYVKDNDCIQIFRGVRDTDVSAQYQDEHFCNSEYAYIKKGSRGSGTYFTDLEMTAKGAATRKVLFI